MSFEFLQSNANREKSKRLLVNDPDIVHARLSQLEKKQQEMSVQMSRQISQLQGKLQGQISQLQGKLQGQISQLQGELNTEKTKTSVLEQTIHTMQSKFPFFIFDNYLLYYLITAKKSQRRIKKDLSTLHTVFIPLEQTKEYKIGICCFSAEHAALRKKSKDLLDRNQDNVSEWGDMSIRRLLFQ